MKPFLFATALSLCHCFLSSAAEPITLNVWPSRPPGETKELPPEADQTKPEDKLIAGRRIIKLGNVSVPQIAVYRAPAEKNTGAAVIICPGGGHHILAYDLEGTEVAEWLSEIGVTAIVLKYRVPFRDERKRWLAAVQDAQRAMSLVRSRSDEWDIDPGRLGILGFSAGGEVAGLVSIFGEERKYDPIDDVDKTAIRPDFAVLIYPGNLVDKATSQMHEYVKITKTCPPMFLVHAYDDGVTALNSLLVAAELKKAGVPSELHLYAAGGHGYGLRAVEDHPVTRWPQPCAAWMKTMGFMGK
jgi:acetyl esterase/lipase